MSRKAEQGFTLIEMMVVIGILAVLLAITLIALNPARQFAQANNTKRKSDVKEILNAINEYQVGNAGQLPSGITTSPQNISFAGANICGALVPVYLAQLPSDPKAANGGKNISATCPNGYDTEYQVVKSSLDNRITVSVITTHQELGQAISVTR